LITQINGAVCQRQEPCASVTVSLSDIKGRNPMAETTSMAGASKATNEAQEAMKKQIAELRREITKINRTLSDQAEEAQGWYDSAADRASRAARQLRNQAHTVSETVQQNPGTISSAMVLGGVFGVLLGIVIAKSSEPERRWF
jgi:chromosome segregation ATPase